MTMREQRKITRFSDTYMQALGDVRPAWARHPHFGRDKCYRHSVGPFSSKFMDRRMELYDWCNAHTTKCWSCDFMPSNDGSNQMSYHFSFQNVNDALVFKLTWGGK